jgi:membrane peptidoglycan carboxypeptidase
MRIRDHGLLANATSLLLCGLLAGLVVAAATFPGLAMVGLAAKAGTDTFEKLPSDFTVVPPPQISNAYASDGKTLLASIYDENRQAIPISEMGDFILDAIVAAEDNNFYNHRGVDLKGIVRAALNNRSGGDRQGASTLTMQYVRQLGLYSAKTPEQVLEATEQTEGRKIREMKYALELEKRMSKEQILEGYLNIASFGENAWGVYAASMVYFDKAPKDLTLAEASLLASLPKAPTEYDPVNPEGKVLALIRSRDYVLKKMVELKFITEAQRQAAIQEDPKIVGNRPSQGCTEVERTDLGAGFFCDYLLRWWAEQEEFGDNEFERENLLRSGGYKIITSLDVETQRIAYKRTQERPGANSTPNDKFLGVMLAAVEPGTGRVQALATNRNFSNNQSGNGVSTNDDKRKLGIKGNYPNTTLPLITGAGQDVPGYQSGSVFKMFTMVAALERGFPLSYSINAVSPYKSKYIISPGPAACGNYYCPRNANPGDMNGIRNMWSGFGQSVNTYFVPLEERVGAENVVDAAKRLGIKFRSRGGVDRQGNKLNGDFEMSEDPKLATQWGAFTLGVSSTTPLDVANAWAALAADGKYCEPIPVNQILDRNGTPLKAGEPRCGAPNTGTTPEVARAAIDAARCPVSDKSPTTKCGSWSTAPGLRNIVGKPLAGKTGTTDADNTATMTATTKQLATSVFVVDPDFPMHPSVGDHKVANNSLAYFMKEALANKPTIDFAPPPASLVNGNQISIPKVKCLDVEAAKKELFKAGFKPEVGQQVDSECPSGRVAGTFPSDRSVKGASIELQLSNGKGTSKPGNARPSLPNER